MARIVPARPAMKRETPLGQALLCLESDLPDAAVIMQSWKGGLLIFSPDVGSCHVVPDDGCDLIPLMPDGRRLVRLELPAVQPGKSLAVTVEAMMKTAGRRDRLSFADTVQLLEALAPGSTPYDGTVSPAQSAWRADNATNGGGGRTAGSELGGLEVLLKNAVTNVTKDDPLTVMGMEVSAGDLVSPTMLLPAVALATAREWAPVIAATPWKYGGFRIRLRRVQGSPCGYVVSAIDMSAPMLFVLPFIEAIKKCRSGDGFVFDGLYHGFVDWMSSRGHETEQDDPEDEIEAEISVGDED